MRFIEVMTKEEKWLLEEKYQGCICPAFDEDKKRLARGEPVAYVIGWQPFLGLHIYLDSHPLIPRPETEWWTEVLIKHLREKYSDKPFTLLDLCAGSGAIGCAVLKHIPHAQVSFGEIMPEHRKTIEKNIKMNNLDDSRAHIMIGDLFTPFSRKKFDVIATNPPYIPENRTLDRSVSDWEPKEALFAGTDGLSLIRKISKEMPAHLNDSGEIWIECDSDHAHDAEKIIAETSMETKILTDLDDRERVIVGKKN